MQQCSHQWLRASSVWVVLILYMKFPHGTNRMIKRLIETSQFFELFFFVFCFVKFLECLNGCFGIFLVFYRDLPGFRISFGDFFGFKLPQRPRKFVPNDSRFRNIPENSIQIYIGCFISRWRGFDVAVTWPFHAWFRNSLWGRRWQGYGGGLTRGQKVKEPTTSILLDLCSWIHGNLFRLFEILMRCFRIFRGIVGQTDRMILQSLFQFLEMIQRFVHDDLWMMIYLLKIWIPGRGDFLTRLKILNKLLKNNSITILLSSEKSWNEHWSSVSGSGICASIWWTRKRKKRRKRMRR